MIKAGWARTEAARTAHWYDRHPVYPGLAYQRCACPEIGAGKHYTVIEVEWLVAWELGTKKCNTCRTMFSQETLRRAEKRAELRKPIGWLSDRGFARRGNLWLNTTGDEVTDDDYFALRRVGGELVE